MDVRHSRPGHRGGSRERHITLSARGSSLRPPRKDEPATLSTGRAEQFHYFWELRQHQALRLLS